MKRKISVFLLFVFLLTNLYSETWQVIITTENPSAKINDAKAFIKITSTTNEPYTVKWSKKDVPLNALEAENLSEGITYTIWIYNQNETKQINFKIPTKGVNEKLNAALIPVVDFLNRILMFDIFAIFKLYDPIVRDDNGNIVTYPNGDPVKKKIPFIVLWLIAGAIFFTIKMNFINIRGFGLSLKLVSGKYDLGEKGEVSHFQALTTALSSTVGLGNIAGVAIAINLGGPGATFWMILAGLLGMSTKFVECTLGVKYREIDKNGVVSGGPMYYIKKGLAKRNWKRLGQILSVIFATFILIGSFGIGNMFQANQALSQLRMIFPQVSDYGYVFGIIMAVLVGMVVIGGIRKIAKVTDKIVPFMALFYVLTALVIIIMNIDKTPQAFKLIIEGAFSAPAIKGGVIGVMIVGFQRAAFSNEAGIGSAPIAHSAVKTSYPVTEGLVALLEPFIDTVVICTMTALVIIYTGYYNVEGLDGVMLTSEAFRSVFSWFPYLLTVSVFLFAFSTMLGWSYYGYNGFKFLFSQKIKNEKILKGIYYSLFLIMIVIGAASSLGAIVDFSDIMILMMAFPNIFTLYILSGEVKNDLNVFLSKIKVGEIKPKK